MKIESEINNYPLRGDLPLLAGEGANLAVGEALALIAAAGPLGDHISGLVRMGERRWDLVLENNSRIMLPETGAGAALDRILALHDVSEILFRDLAAVDLRNSERLIVRLSEEGVTEFHRLRALVASDLIGRPRGAPRSRCRQGLEAPQADPSPNQDG